MRHVLFALLFFSTFMQVRGQSHKIVSLSFEEKDFSFLESDGYHYLESSKHSLSFDTDTSAPALPWIGITLLIGENDSFQSVEVNRTNAVPYVGIKIGPNFPLDVTGVTTSNPRTSGQIQYTSFRYPTDPIIYTGTHIADGYKFLSFQVSPFSYFPSEDSLCLYSHITLDIKLGKDISANKTPRKFAKIREGYVMRDIIRDLAINGSEQDSLYEREKNISSRISRDSSEYIEYLIITTEQLKPTFNALAEWKTQKGVRTKVITKDDVIAHQGHALSLPVRIKKEIKYYKENYGIKYVLLAGDTNIIPTVECVVRYNDAIAYTPCDLFYSCLDTIDWDSNYNGIIGEETDSFDMAPDIFVSRISARNIDQAEAQVSRIIEYERNPDINSWENKMLMCGVKLFYYKMVNGRQASDAELVGEMMFNDSIAPLWNGTQFRFYDTRTDSSLDSLYQVTPEHLSEQIANGYNFINVGTHGSFLSWAMENSNSFNCTNASNVINNGYSLVVTTACNTNDFSVMRCLSEALMVNANSGIIGYWGCSISGWSYSYTPYVKFGPSDLRNIQFYKNLFTDSGNHLGEIVQKSKMAFINTPMDSTHVNRWLHFGLNILGDPEMPIFTDTPCEFENVTFTFNNGTLSINTGVEGCRVCVQGKIDDEVCYYRVYNNIREDAILQVPINMDYSICITKPGYKPYIVYVLSKDYIQNESISSNRIYLNDGISIGSDVIPLQGNGPVSIEGGKTIIFNQSGTMIKNDFEVKKGAIFEIK